MRAPWGHISEVWTYHCCPSPVCTPLTPGAVVPLHSRGAVPEVKMLSPSAVMSNCRLSNWLAIWHSWTRPLML